MIPLKAYLHLYDFERSFVDVVDKETPLETWYRVTGQSTKEDKSNE